MEYGGKLNGLLERKLDTMEGRTAYDLYSWKKAGWEAKHGTGRRYRTAEGGVP
jgi:hypothetical protein